MPYANQGHIGLQALSHENPRLLFTEYDRRMAHAMLRGEKSEHIDRLAELQDAGSHQANYFLGRLFGLPEPVIHNGLVANYDEIVNQSWLAQQNGEYLKAKTAIISAGINPDSLVSDGK